MPKKFEDFMLFKNDEIDNAAYALAVALLRTSPEQSNDEILAWDMQIIAPIIEATINVLNGFDKECCYPFNTYRETPCYRTKDCKNKNCPHENAVVADILKAKEQKE